MKHPTGRKALLWTLASPLALALSCSSSQQTPAGGTAANECAEGQLLCDGVCADVAVDVYNCGSCGNSCLTGQVCQAGSCQCMSGLTACGADCVDTTADPANCGDCGVACAPGQSCSAGQCATSCAAGLTACGQSCVDLATNLSHCGACDSPCAAGQTCVGGACACPTGLTLCDGQCVDLLSSTPNCGACGNACAVGQVCSAGSCVSGMGTGGSGGSATGGSGGAPSGGSGAQATGGSGGATSGGTGGEVSGGTGGDTSGGTGGEVSGGTGGEVTGGSGGDSSGGDSSGGDSSGGDSSGGSGGEVSGGSGGEVTGGTGGSTTQFPFMLGADISGTQESNTTYRDTDGQTKSIFDLLKNHGFNYIRLRTFVDPMAPYGYASSANGCSGKSEAYGDRDHVVAYGQQVKAAGMGFLLDFHYSDNWADPGNQIIPEAWRNVSSISELASLLRAYTVDVVSTAVNAGARPDMVQVGNEITPGVCAHVPNAQTDCWGNNVDSAPIGGSTSNWDNLATLLIAGIEGVHEVDPTIKTVLHIENTANLSGVKWWVDSARSRGVDFDVLGLSCYTAWQGPPSTWEATFNDLAASYPDLEFIIAEYNPERTQANLIMKNLPDGRGLGTFFWEPTSSGEWGDAMFSWEGGASVANADDFAEYDALLPQLGL